MLPHPKNISIQDFTYSLPEDRIARYPLPQRDSSKLLIWKNGAIEQNIYKNIADYIPNNSLVIFNQTKVVNARLIFHKPTGGKVEIFCLQPDSRYADIPTAMLSTKEVYWKCLVGGAHKWKEDIILKIENNNIVLNAQKMGQDKDGFLIHFSWNSNLSFAEILHELGVIPLPPYLHREAEEADNKDYQTIFAKDEGSVAAPTAALHFTEPIVQSLQNNHCLIDFVTLHVGAGTFMPVKSDTMLGHTMHAEWIEVSIHFIKRLITYFSSQSAKQGAVISVGTTSTRTLESLYWIGVRLIREEEIDFNELAVTQWYPYDNDADIPVIDALTAIDEYMNNHILEKLLTRTQIIIAPGYQYRVIDALVTNFHQPQSTLLLLVAALIGNDWKKLYEYALTHDFRFLSYGDGSLIWKPAHK